MAYVIKDWDRIYENAQSRKVEKLLWVAVPNKHDSFGFRILLSKPNGVALYGAWVLLVQLASKCEPRGTLIKAGITLDIPTISMLTNAPESILSEMLQAVQTKGIEWLSMVDPVDSQSSTTQLVDRQVLETTQPGTRVRAHSSFLPSLLPSSEQEVQEQQQQQQGRTPGVLPEKSGSLPSVPEPEPEPEPQRRSLIVARAPMTDAAMMIAECADRMYTLHPKKKNLVLVPGALQSSLNGSSTNPQPFLIEVETCHAAWCKTEDWTKNGGRFAPPLDQWISDRGYTKWPSDLSSEKKGFVADVERVMARNMKEKGKPW